MDFDFTQLIKMQSTISELSKRGIPIAIQQTLNNTARHSWKEGRSNTDEIFNNRNRWTARSQNYQRTQELDPDKMETEAGSSASYLAEQETGFSRTSDGKAGVWVPTAAAAGQDGQRTKPVAYRYRKGKMRIMRKMKRAATSPSQARLFKLHNAVIGNGLFWGTLGNTTGMWLIDGSMQKSRLSLTSVRLLYSANKNKIDTSAHQWHEPAVEQAIRLQPDEYFKALDRQVKRLKRKHGIK